MKTPKMKKRWQLVLLLGVFSFGVSFLVYLMLQVLFAQILQTTLLQSSKVQSPLNWIVFLGFLLSMLIAFLSQFLISLESRSEVGLSPQKIFHSSVYAFAINLIVWISISFYQTLNNFGNLLPDPEGATLFLQVWNQGIIYIVSIPQMLSIFAIYTLGNPVLFWFYAFCTYSVFYTTFLIF